MANQRVTAMPQNTDPQPTDLLHLVDDPAGTAANNRIELEDLLPTFLRTAAEVAAAVTPSDYMWPEGDVRRYGALLDGSTNDRQALIDADAVATNNGNAIYIPRSASGMAISATTTVVNPIYCEPGAFILYTGSAEEEALRIGVVTGNTLNLVFYNLDVRRNVQADWTDFDNVGIRVLNLDSCIFYNTRTANFSVGLLVEGNDYGCANNHFYGGKLHNCGRMIMLTNRDTSLTQGFCNDNHFTGLRMTNDTGVNAAVTRYGHYITSERATVSYCNGNTFRDCNFEMNNAGSGTATPAFVEYGNQNRWRECRDEGNDSPFAISKNLSTENDAEVHIPNQPVWQNDGVYKNNRVRSLRQTPMANHNASWTSDAVHRTCNEYDGAAAVYVPKCSWRNSSNGNQHLAIAGATLTDDYMDIPSTRGLGVVINTTILKRFVFSRDCESGRGGRTVVIPYDANRAALTLTDTFVDGDVTVGTDRITVTSHPFTDGDRVQLTTTGTLPTGLATSTDYFVNSVDANTIEFYTDFDLTTIVDITAASGGGTHTIQIESHVDGSSGSDLAYHSNSGGCYRSGADAETDQFFSVSTATKYIWVGVFGGTSSARLRAFGVSKVPEDDGAISADQGELDVNSDPFPNDALNYATAAPVTSNAGPSYPAGKELIIFNTAANADGVLKCTTQGAGGTAVWESQGDGNVRSTGTTGGSGSAGAGNQFVQLEINGTVYQVLHDGTV